MNILFRTMSKMQSVESRGIYTDLMRKFRKEGHCVYIVTPSERRDGMPTSVIEEDRVKILSVRTLNVQKTNVIEKGLGQVSIEFLYKRAIEKYFKNISFDELWTDYLQPLLQDYVRGLNDEEECMKKFARAYGYKALSEGDVDETAQD